MQLDLRPHQEDALSRMHNGSILCGIPGSGKSWVAVEYYMKMEADANVYVITTAKKRDDIDWETDFARVGIGKQQNATRGGLLTVDSWQNIGKYREVRNAFFIFDEQRAVGSGQWASMFIRIAQRNRWIMLSGTPGDTWLDYIPVFVANGFYKHRTEFKREHVVYNTYSKFPKVDRYTGVGRLVRHRNSILVQMPYMTHTVRHELTVPVEYDQKLFDRVVKDRWHVYENRPLKGSAELFLVMRKVANSDSSRLDQVKKLLVSHPKIIVFYNFNYELEALRTLGIERPSLLSTSGTDSGSTKKSSDITNRNSLSKTSAQCSTNLVVAEWNGHKHQPIPTSDRWVYLVQYVAGAEGWNCIDTDVTLFYSLTYSYKVWRQAHGRIDRMNTPYTDLYYYTLYSQSAIDKAVLGCLKQKKSFNEGAYLPLLADTDA